MLCARVRNCMVPGTLVVGLLFGGCFSDDRLTLSTTVLESLDPVRHSLGGESRDGWTLGGGEPIAIGLGEVKDGDAIRLGYFDAKANKRGSIYVYVGDRRVATIPLEGTAHWQDTRIDVETPTVAPIRVVVESAEPLRVAPLEVIRPASAAAKPNVLVLLVDTLRQDHMSVYGYERTTTPVMEAFAKDATLLTELVPSSSWTRPSVATLFTSMHPAYHGAETIRHKLREDLPSLAQALGDAGYATTGLMTNANCTEEWGFGGDFQRYVYVDTYMESQTDDDTVAADLAIAALNRLRGRPWYLYVHFMSPHQTYAPPEPFRSKFDEDLSELDLEERAIRGYINLYDGEIARSDFEFGRILDSLKASGQYDDTLIVVLSDHGEEFREHGGLTHGRSLYEEVLRVPLIVKPPHAAWAVPSRVDNLVEMVDIAPTILDIVGVPAPHRFQGQSFLSALHGEFIAPRTGYASLTLGWHSMRAAKTVSHKYIRDSKNDIETWFDLEADPGELTPLAVPGPWSEILSGRVARQLVAGATGLHLLFVSDGMPRDASITIGCATCTESTLTSAEWNNELAREGDTLHWTFQAGQVNPIPPQEQPAQAANRVHAHLQLDVAPEETIILSARLAGMPIDPQHVHAGADREHLGLNETVLAPLHLVAPPDEFSLATIPTGLGLYLWYVPPAQALTDEEIPAELREKLEALGYVP